MSSVKNDVMQAPGKLKSQVLEDIRDVRRHVHALMHPGQHTNMLSIACGMAGLFLLVGVAGNRMVLAYDACNDKSMTHHENPALCLNINQKQAGFGGVGGLACRDGNEAPVEFIAPPSRIHLGDHACSIATDCSCESRPDSYACRAPDLTYWCEKTTITGRKNCLRKGKCVGHDTRQTFKQYSAGLFAVDFGSSNFGKLCDDWPLQRNSSYDFMDEACPSVRASRAFFIMALVFSIIGVVAGSVRNIVRKDAFPVPTAAFVVASSFCGMVGHIVWQARVQYPLGRELRHAVHAHLIEAGDKSATGISEYWYSTLGYSYALLMFAWLLPCSILMVKLFFDSLEITNLESLPEAERERVKTASVKRKEMRRQASLQSMGMGRQRHSTEWPASY